MNNNDTEKIFKHFDANHDVGIALGDDGAPCIVCHSCKEDLFHFHRNELTSKQMEWYRSQAAEQYEEEGKIEIDDGAMISEGHDPGAYVQAWVWVPTPEHGEGP